MYYGINTLYKLPDQTGYCLCVTKSGHTPAEFNRVCNILSEYSNRMPTGHGAEAHAAEHFEVVVADKALQVMSQL